MSGDQPSILGNERGFAQPLTASAATWLATPPDAAEQTRISDARQILAANQAEGDRLLGDEEQYIRLSLELFRQPLFAPLQFAPWVVEQVLAEFGEPPVVEDDADPAFSDYLRRAVLWVGTSRVRRTIADQARRFLPMLVIDGDVQGALALERNAYLTVMSEAATPLLVQMMVAALASWYEANEEEPI